MFFLRSVEVMLTASVFTPFFKSPILFAFRSRTTLFGVDGDGGTGVQVEARALGQTVRPR